MATKKAKDAVLKEDRVAVGSLKNALEITEGVHDDLGIKMRNGRGNDLAMVKAKDAVSNAGSNLRQALRALGVNIPVRKGPKPGTMTKEEMVKHDRGIRKMGHTGV